MSVQSYLCAILALITSSSLVACDKPSRPSEAAAQEVSARELAGEPAAAGAAAYHYVTNGPQANLDATSLDGAVYHDTYLEISATGTDQAYLNYFLLECSLTTFECETVEGGFGMVSGDDLTTSRDRITVNTNTAENPTFELWEGSGGPINVTWTQLSGWSSRYTIHSRYVQASYSSHSHGTFDNGPALAEGTVVGVQLLPGSGYASMGTVKEGGIDIERQR